MIFHKNCCNILVGYCKLFLEPWNTIFSDQIRSHFIVNFSLISRACPLVWSVSYVNISPCTGPYQKTQLSLNIDLITRRLLSQTTGQSSTINSLSTQTSMRLRSNDTETGLLETCLFRSIRRASLGGAAGPNDYSVTSVTKQ